MFSIKRWIEHEGKPLPNFFNDKELRLQFHAPHLPFSCRLTTLVIVLCSLLILRQFEKHRRRIAVWVFDLTRLAISYASADILMLVLVLPFASGFPRDGGPQFHGGGPLPGAWRHKGPPQMPPSPMFRRNMFSPFRNDEPPGWPSLSMEARGPGNGIPDFNEGHRLQFLIHQSTSLTLTTLEVFPGIPLIYGLYMLLLYVFYQIKLYWNKSLSRVRLIRDPNNGGWVIRTRPPPGRDHLSFPQDRFMAEGDYNSQENLGFISGNYGHPVRIQWFGQQTATLALAIFIVRAIIVKVCSSYVYQTNKLRLFLYGWTGNISSPPLAMLIIAVLLPSILHSSQLCVSDYLFRYRSGVGKGQYKSFVLPFYGPSVPASPGTLEAEDDEGYELQELSLPQLHIDYEERNMEAGFGTARPSSGMLSSRGRRPASPNVVTVPSDSSISPGVPLPVVSPNAPTPSSSNDNIEEEIEAMVEDIRDFGKQAIDKVKRIDAVNIGLQYGIVTASLLNAAAVNATANARPLFFASRGGFGAGLNQFQLPTREPSPSQGSNRDPYYSPSAVPAVESNLGLDSLDSDNESEDSYDEDDENGNDYGLESDEDVHGLPSYDVSQQQQQELLRNPSQANRHHHVLSEMKRA